MPTLKKEDIHDGILAIQKYKKFGGIIADRIFEIVKIICRCYGAKDKDMKDMWWDYAGDNRDYGDGGSLDKSWGATSIEITVQGVDSRTSYQWPDELNNVPISWLTMSDQDIENEVLAFIKSLKDEEAAEIKRQMEDKQKKAAAKELKKKIMADAMAKLTRAEKQALGIK